MDKNFSKVEGMLYNYKSIKAEIKNIELEIMELETDYKGCGSITYEEKTGATNKFNSSVENEMISRRKRLDYLLNLKRKKENIIKRIDNALEILEEQQLRVIELRYFSNKKLGWFTIAEIMSISDVTCRTLRKNAINKIISVIFI